MKQQGIFMKKIKNTDTQIVNILKQNQVGESAANLCREYGMSQATFYKYRSKYGDADVNIVKKLKEVENSRLEFDRWALWVIH